MEIMGFMEDCKSWVCREGLIDSVPTVISVLIGSRCWLYNVNIQWQDGY